MSRLLTQLNLCHKHIWQFIFAAIFNIPFQGFSQQTNTYPVNPAVIESVAESTGEETVTDENFLQEAEYFRKNPIDLNSAPAETLAGLQLLTPLQVSSLILYRQQLGKLISLYELQAIPGWDIQLIEKLRPFITVSNSESLPATFRKRIHGGSHELLARVSQVLERSSGYKIGASGQERIYQGSPQKIRIGYRYRFQNLLDYGFIAEKDPGEQFFRGAQKKGFDFYTAHLFARDIGHISALALGDYTVNLGQGLIHWQALAFGKSTDVTNVKRQSPVLRPYNSAGEYNFHRGAGITISKRSWEATLFISSRKLDGNLVSSDSTGGNENIVSSFLTSGLHRTKNEISDRGVLHEWLTGGNVTFKTNSLKLGVNMVAYRYGYPLVKQQLPYNLYAFSGKKFHNLSIDYGFTLRNLHLFGETAAGNGKSIATVDGILVSASPDVDFVAVLRYMPVRFHSFYSSAFTENTLPTNETGIYMGSSVRISQKWRLDAFADFYRFPWLRYQADAPSSGSDYLFCLAYKPRKQLECIIRYRVGHKPANQQGDESLLLCPVIIQTHQQCRLQMLYNINSSFSIRNRVELTWVNRHSRQSEEGYLGYFDLLYHPPLKPYSANGRIQYFETTGYNSRIYAYENDVLYSYSVPAFFGKGFHYYLNISYDVNSRISCWARFSRVVHDKQNGQGSGPDFIPGNHRTEARLQIRYRF